VTLKTKVANFLLYAQGDDVQTYLQKWLTQSWLRTDALFDPVAGHNHNGTGNNGPVVSGGGGVTLNWRGTWSSSIAYAKNDGVTYNGSSYIALAAVGPTSTTPDADPTHWGVLAQGGATGPQGPPGNTGAQGPAGPQGATGATGAQGPQGNPGPTGATGTQGPKGDTGATGAQGPQGNPGPTGATGATGPAGTPGAVWWTGTGAPASATGVPGDFYLNSATGDYYQKTSSTVWILQGNIRGPQGATGATGPQGPTGATGAQGPQGNPGATGATGPQGPTGATGPVGLTWRGNWVSTNSYAINDAVFYGTTGSSYICTTGVSSGGAAPPSDTAHWALLASGATGTWGSP